MEILEGRDACSISPISPTAGYPFTSIVELQATFPDHRTFVGSGVMIDRFHVLTAGHVVYAYAEGGFASQIRVTPELSGNAAPFGVAYMTYERTYTPFMNYNRAHPGSTAAGDYDVALITLDRTIGDRTGWMGFGYDNNNADFAPGAILNTAGYPAIGGYDGRHLEFSYGPVAGLTPDGSAITYRQSAITTFGGQSGSPVWRYTPATGASIVYGVHVGGNGTAGSVNFATRITPSIYADLQAWRAADRTPAYSVAAPTLEVQSLILGVHSWPAVTGNAQATTLSQDAQVIRSDGTMMNPRGGGLLPPTDEKPEEPWRHAPVVARLQGISSWATGSDESLGSTWDGKLDSVAPNIERDGP
jgi:V8-like Glu-specific endopeptidase